MKVIKQLFNFYLDASFHVALSVLSLLYATDILLNIELDYHLNYFVFFGTVAAYNFVKYGVEAKKYVMVSNKNHKKIQIVSIIALVIAMYHVFFLHKNALIFMAVVVIMTALYAIPVLPKAKNLRSLGGLKIFIVAFVWAGATVILPAVESLTPISRDILIESLQRFLLVLILLVPFEIRDLAYDNPSLRTLPQRYGVTKTILFGSFTTIVFYTLTFLKEEILIIDIIGKGTLFLSLGFLMFFTRRDQKKYFASFWVEAIPIFWLIILHITILQL
ncbi:hypothetical protein KO500_11960 [Cellulophaga baltica]|uniref:hypothetical protein n=1 Tax=Cellulophaga TaxID=104264 RepID=UPI001C06682A|nr:MULTISPECIES: hypothetical protein [Cellulophaga]MBU2997155.1 hypothetical protein [Cellulophaga baltica]MDO6768553.1 hypothetical protein [Cellulophaga sp. 1_MG-2023]